MSELPRADGNPNDSEGKLYESFAPAPETEQHEGPETKTEAAIDVLGKEVDAIREQLKELPQAVRKAVIEIVQPLMDRVDSLEQANVTITPTVSPSPNSTSPIVNPGNDDRRYAVPRTQEETAAAAQEAEDAAYGAFQAESSGGFASDSEAYDAHLEARRREHGEKMERTIFEGNNPEAKRAYLLAQLVAEKRAALDAGILKGEISEDSERAKVTREDIADIDSKIATLLSDAETNTVRETLEGKRVLVTPISKEVSDFIMDAAVESPVFEAEPVSEAPTAVETNAVAAPEDSPVETIAVDENTTAESMPAEQSDSEKAREIAKDYDLSDPVQMGKYRAALEAAGIDASGKDAKALKDIVEGSEDFQQDATRAEETPEDKAAERTRKMDDSDKQFDALSSETSATDNNQTTENGAEAQPETIEALNEAAKKALAERRELELRGLREGIDELKAKEITLRNEGKADEADAVANEIIGLQNQLAALEAESKEAEPRESLSPNLDGIEPSPEVEDTVPHERAKRNWFMRKVDWAKAKFWQKTTEGQAALGEAREEAVVAAHGDKYEDYVKSINGKEARTKRYEAEAEQELRAAFAREQGVEDPSKVELPDDIDKLIAKVVRSKEREFQKSIENTGWNHMKNLARESRPISREGLSDEEYQDAKSHKRKVIIGAVAIGAPVIIAGTLIGAKAAGAFDHLFAGAEAHTLESASSDGFTNPRDHMTEEQFREFKGLDTQQQPETTYPPLTELDPQPGDYNADNIDVEYSEYLSLDKVSDYAMGPHLDMTSVDTAVNGLFDRAEGGPDQASQMSNVLTNQQIEHFGFTGLTPQQIGERLHDDALRADVLNTINADYENGSATTTILTADDLRQLEGKVDSFYNWGAKPIDANGNEISIEEARAQGITDTELVQYQISLQELIDRGASLLKVTNADGETVYFNSLCQNMLTEIPHQDVPIVEEPHHPVEPPQPTEPTYPTEPTHPTEPTVPTEPTHPTEPTYPTEPTHPTEPTVPTEPTYPTEPTPTPPVTPEPKDPNEDINVNPDLPDQLEVTDPVDSGDYQPEDTVTTPPDNYVEPTPEPSHETAPEAEPVTPEVREDEVQDAPKADDANGPVDPGTQEQLEESGAGQLEDGQGNDGRVEG